MTRSDDRRTAIIDALADHVLVHGLPGASLRPLAAAAGLSDRMLLYYFKDKAEIIAAILERIAARLTLLLGSGGPPQPFETLRQHLFETVLADGLWPYMCVWLEIAALAARGDPLYATTGERIARGFLAWGAAQLDSPPDRCDADALHLLTLVEGTVLLRSLKVV